MVISPAALALIVSLIARGRINPSYTIAASLEKYCKNGLQQSDMIDIASACSSAGGYNYDLTHLLHRRCSIFFWWYHRPDINGDRKCMRSFTVDTAQTSQEFTTSIQSGTSSVTYSLSFSVVVKRSSITTLPMYKKNYQSAAPSSAFPPFWRARTRRPKPEVATWSENARPNVETGTAAFSVRQHYSPGPDPTDVSYQQTIDNSNAPYVSSNVFPLTHNTVSAETPARIPTEILDIRRNIETQGTAVFPAQFAARLPGEADVKDNAPGPPGRQTMENQLVGVAVPISMQFPGDNGGALFGFLTGNNEVIVTIGSQRNQSKSLGSRSTTVLPTYSQSVSTPDGQPVDGSQAVGRAYNYGEQTDNRSFPMENLGLRRLNEKLHDQVITEELVDSTTQRLRTEIGPQESTSKVGPTTPAVN
ncbi:hypothetical protein DFJ73DRAFT_769520 [Zopfochytrium polystomum]|nr:hypothetical protein DFJ73DRAFT_769520 [Zopfochytrium polystomum]